VLRSVREV